MLENFRLHQKGSFRGESTEGNFTELSVLNAKEKAFKRILHS